MHRREVLKGLAALPLAGVLTGCDHDKRGKEERSHVVEVHLEGAFALVIQENKENSILAFSPRPPAGEEEHQFYFNGSHDAENTTKPVKFNLSLDKQDHGRRPEIDPGLKDFHFTTENWRVGDSLVTLELPAPTEITFSGHRLPVTFQSDHRKAFISSNHILRYELPREAQPKLDCGGLNHQCSPEDSYDGVTRFFFEVGPKRYLKHEESQAHAIRYFNYVLQQSFPDLAAKFSLEDPYKKQGTTQSRLVPAVFQYDAQPATLNNVSYIVDCEVALPSAGTRTAAKP
ncbi:MAG TPA: hypothetical protein VGJ33_09195 [Candidatus Angelobacter sp.]|jgi:hypothetical protein